MGPLGSLGYLISGRKKTPRRPVQLELECQLHKYRLGYTDPQKVFVIYVEFTFHWVFCQIAPHIPPPQGGLLALLTSCDQFPTLNTVYCTHLEKSLFFVLFWATPTA